jgi:hypothetical protein
MHVEQVQLAPDVVGGFIPTAAQSNPTTAGGVFFSCPGRGASQTVHLSSAEAGFESMHSSHSQFPPSAAMGGFFPAVAQSKVTDAEADPASVFVGPDVTEKLNKGREDTGVALAAFRSAM